MPSPKEARWIGTGFMSFAGLVLLTLLTTTPPPGRYYPEWAFWLAGFGIVAGLALFVASFFIPDRERDVQERILEALREHNELTKHQLQEQTHLAPRVVESGVIALEAEGKVEVSGEEVKWTGSYADGY